MMQVVTSRRLYMCMTHLNVTPVYPRSAVRRAPHDQPCMLSVCLSNLAFRQSVVFSLPVKESCQSVYSI